MGKSQVIINSDRLIFNAKNENIILSAKKEIGLSNYISGSAKQSKLKIYKLNTNSSNLKADGSIIIRPIFTKLPSIDQVLKNKIKKIKNKNKKLKKKLEKDKDW